MGMTSKQAEDLGRLVRRTRKRQRLSLRELGHRLQIPTSWLGHLEQGRYADPAPDRLNRICEALDIDPARLHPYVRQDVSDSLPEMTAYFRTKYRLSPAQVARIARYVERVQKEEAQ